MLAEVITGLPSRLEEHSVPLALYDLAYNLGIARRLIPALPLARETATYARVSDAWNADQLRILDAAVRIASDGDLAAARRFVSGEEPRVRRFDRALLDETEDALRAVEQAVRASGHRLARAHTRGQLLSAVAFSMALAGCSRPLLSPDGGRDAPGDRSRSAESRSVDTTGTGARPKSPSRTGPADPIRPTPDFNSTSITASASAGGRK